MKIILILISSCFYIGLLAGCSSAGYSPSQRQRDAQTGKKGRGQTARQDSGRTGKQFSSAAQENAWTTFQTALTNSKWQIVIDQSEILLKDSNLTATQLSEIYKGRERVFSATELYYNWVGDLQEQIANSLFKNEASSLSQKASDLIQNKLLPVDLERLTEGSFDADLKAAAYFRLAQIALDDKNTDLCKRLYSKAYNLSPNSDLGLRAKTLLEQLETARRVAPKTIGVVLPMSGKFATISKKTLRGIQLGLGLTDSSRSSFTIAVVDSEGNPESARRGVERLVAEDNVIAIIGSVLSKTSAAVASKASELGVPSITLSQKAGVTELSPQVFRNSLTSEMQVHHLVKTAMDDLGMKRFAILFPNDQYGVEFANIFWDEVLARGGSISGAQSYSNKETDFRFAVQRLIGTYYIEDRADEYKYRLKEWTDAQSKKSARSNPPDDLLPPVIDFDAIFIPDSMKSLGQISAMLSYNGVRGGVKLMGTNLWNVPGIAKRVGVWSKDILFVDSYVSTDPSFQNSSFVREYKSQFGEEPGLFEIQGYDTAVMLRHLVSDGATSRESLTSALANLDDFPAAIGSLSMSPDREVLRPIVTLTLEGSEIIPLAPLKR